MIPSEEQEYAKKMMDVWATEDLTECFLKDSEKRIKKDRPTKLAVFYTALSAFLPEPMNLFPKGQSGVGKTINVTETLRYFPKENVVFLGGVTPKSFVYEHGTLMNQVGQPIDSQNKPTKPERSDYENKEEYKKAKESYRLSIKDWNEQLKNSYSLINLSYKILVFLECPEYEVFHNLLPILSHDKERIEFKFVEKTGKGQFVTRKAAIQGWPATIFLSTDKEYVEELSTRGFTITPDDSVEKIAEANKLTNQKSSMPWEYDHEDEESKTIRKLVESLKLQFAEQKFDIVVPFLNIHELLPRQIVRDMRDCQHFFQFVKTITALHFYQRALIKKNDKKYVTSSAADVIKAFEIYKEIFETTRTGTEKRILDFYYGFVMAGERWYVKDLTAAYNKGKQKKISDYTIRTWLERLNQIGYVEIQSDELDKRCKLYFPLVKEKEEKTFENTCNLEKPELLTSKLRESFKSWTTNIGNEVQLTCYKNTEKGWVEEKLSFPELERLCLNDERKPSNLQQGLDPSSKREDIGPNAIIGAEIARNAEMQTIPSISEKKSLSCPFCDEQSKLLIFSSSEDLDLHVETVHSEKPLKYMMGKVVTVKTELGQNILGKLSSFKEREKPHLPEFLVLETGDEKIIVRHWTMLFANDQDLTAHVSICEDQPSNPDFLR